MSLPAWTGIAGHLIEYPYGFGPARPDVGLSAQSPAASLLFSKEPKLAQAVGVGKANATYPLV